MFVSLESRDIVVEVTLASPNVTSDTVVLPHALVQLSYSDTLKHALVGPIALTAHIARPNNKEVSWPNPYVACQWLRVRTVRVSTNALTSIANGDGSTLNFEMSHLLNQIIDRADRLSKDGEVDMAKEVLTNWIEEFHKEAFEIGMQEDALVKQLLKDLTECLDVLKRKDYSAYAENELGVKMNTHYFQRCSEPIMSGKHK